MAVPTSGSISMRNVARERRYNDVGVNGYSSGSLVNLTNISMYDLMRGGNANGSDYTFCPPMDNLFTVNGFQVVAPYDPNLEQGSGYTATPYAMSEYRGHVGNRELGCVKLNYGGCFPTGNQTISAAAAGQSFRWDFDLDYTPKGSGAIIYMEITSVSWAGLSTSSNTTTGGGSANINFTASSGNTIRYLNVATNTGSARSLTLSIYISGSCYSSNNLVHTVTVNQAAGSGGGGGGLPTPGGGNQ